MSKLKNMPPSHENSKLHKEKYKPLPESIEKIASLVVDSAYTVHQNLGLGLLEKGLVF